MTSIGVRPVTTAEHLAFVDSQPSVSFLQTPAWAEVKSEWRHESVGFSRAGELVGVGLVLYRQMPRIKRSLAYLPEGPVLDWHDTDLDVAGALEALASYVRHQGAFAVRIGPLVVTRTWSADTVKKALADEGRQRLSDVPASTRHPVGEALQARLRHAGWRQVSSARGFSAGQPQYVFQLPLTGRTEDDVLKGMNQQWRRNIKRADKAGVEVVQGDSGELKAFHDLYTETAARDGFLPRPLTYFERMFQALQGEQPDRVRLYLARFDGELVAATTWVRVGRHVWYSYGASSTAHRDVRGSNAIQWQMIRDALAVGADVYDLRGITETLDPSDAHAGLIQFKVGTGGEALEYVGEWDLPLNRVLYRGFDLYMGRR